MKKSFYIIYNILLNLFTNISRIWEDFCLAKSTIAVDENDDELSFDNDNIIEQK